MRLDGTQSVWGESPIRMDFPDKLRLAIDAMDPKHRQRTFRLLAKTSGEYGLDAASQAGEHIVEQGHAIDEASLTALARRISARARPRTTSPPRTCTPTTGS